MGDVSVENLTEYIEADTVVDTIELDKYALKNLMLEDDTLQLKMDKILRSRIEGSWQAIQANSIISQLSVGQKTLLQSIIEKHTLNRGDIVKVKQLENDVTVEKAWKYGNPVSFAV